MIRANIKATREKGDREGRPYVCLWHPSICRGDLHGRPHVRAVYFSNKSKHLVSELPIFVA
jgi:hypothetical protein